MNYSLRLASSSDKAWLDALRREAYRDLFNATWGGWDEARHQRHFSESWKAGHISIIVSDEKPVGMIQLVESPESVQVAEIQILPEQQNHGLGARVLCDAIETASKCEKPVSLYLGLKNFGAYSLYKRLGFKETRRSDTHIFMIYRQP